MMMMLEKLRYGLMATACLCLLDQQHFLRDRLGGRADAADRQKDIVAQKVRGEALDLPVIGCTSTTDEGERGKKSVQKLDSNVPLTNVCAK